MKYFINRLKGRSNLHFKLYGFITNYIFKKFKIKINLEKVYIIIGINFYQQKNNKITRKKSSKIYCNLNISRKKEALSPYIQFSRKWY